MLDGRWEPLSLQDPFRFLKNIPVKIQMNLLCGVQREAITILLHFFLFRRNIALLKMEVVLIEPMCYLINILWETHVKLETNSVQGLDKILQQIRREWRIYETGQIKDGRWRP